MRKATGRQRVASTISERLPVLAAFSSTAMSMRSCLRRLLLSSLLRKRSLSFGLVGITDPSQIKIDGHKEIIRAKDFINLLAVARNSLMPLVRKNTSYEAYGSRYKVTLPPHPRISR